MSLQNVWFEKAWSRYMERREKIERYRALYSYTEECESRDICNMIMMAMSITGMLDVRIERHKEDRWRFKMSFLVEPCCRNEYDVRRIMDALAQGLDKTKPVGVKLELELRQL